MNPKFNPVGWFEIPVTDMSRAKAFYEYVFGFELSLNEMGPMIMAWFPMVNEAYGTTGSLVKGEGSIPSDRGVVIYFTAPDLEAALDRAREKGGKVLYEKTSIGEYGFIGIILDTEGNQIGLHSRE